MAGQQRFNAQSFIIVSNQSISLLRVYYAIELHCSHVRTPHPPNWYLLFNQFLLRCCKKLSPSKVSRSPKRKKLAASLLHTTEDDDNLAYYIHTLLSYLLLNYYHYVCTSTTTLQYLVYAGMLLRSKVLQQE